LGGRQAICVKLDDEAGSRVTNLSDAHGVFLFLLQWLNERYPVAYYTLK
jgi:hypothetical protein